MTAKTEGRGGVEGLCASLRAGEQQAYEKGLISFGTLTKKRRRERSATNAGRGEAGKTKKLCEAPRKTTSASAGRAVVDLLRDSYPDARDYGGKREGVTSP